MALIDLNALLLEVNTAQSVELTNLKGYADLLTFTSLSEQSRGIIKKAQEDSLARSTTLRNVINAITALQVSGYPARTYPVIDMVNITQINAEIDTEVAGIHKVMKKLGSLV
jgi:hypothetical protein